MDLLGPDLGPDLLGFEPCARRVVRRAAAADRPARALRPPGTFGSPPGTFGRRGAARPNHEAHNQPAHQAAAAWHASNARAARQFVASAGRSELSCPVRFGRGEPGLLLGARLRLVLGLPLLVRHAVDDLARTFLA